MKEEKIRKMREGKAKKNLKNSLTASSTVPQKNQSALEEEKYQPIKDLVPLHKISGAPRVVLKDGNAVIVTMLNDNYDEKNQLIEVKKPDRVTSNSFKPREHTDKWTPEENKKFYKVKTIFNYL